jgi:hypothetical protein
MLLYWKIRYLDRNDKKFKDRCLYLKTNSLDPITRAAVEFIAENKSAKSEREIINFKHLFIEGDFEHGIGHPNDCGKFIGVGPCEYFGLFRDFRTWPDQNEEHAVS